MEPDYPALLRAARADALTAAVARERDIGSLIEASRGSNGDDEHDPEGATIGFERAQASSIARGARARLDEIDRALAKLDAGTFGACEYCGKPIGAGRLAARPYARLCVDCQRSGG
ncbi:TraR/DksA family transcriptional regulator [Rarobacter incanus]|uniref:TraR/DksA family transcriptional regulator n=1 Tax=Rarobacter incanus TaxID=153494 RepID=A0A542SQB3_9MICO|nr:TraR/DksA C4-type zinc finger protein [Rarobacter incanus]TQK76457.1 TraR/DksA family transcriptional regulator [Rarobacter incanus]